MILSRPSHPVFSNPKMFERQLCIARWIVCVDSAVFLLNEHVELLHLDCQLHSHYFMRACVESIILADFGATMSAYWTDYGLLYVMLASIICDAIT